MGFSKDSWSAKSCVYQSQFNVIVTKNSAIELLIDFAEINHLIFTALSSKLTF